jgi:hypothetical protein
LVALRREKVRRWRRAAVLGLAAHALAIAIVLVVFVVVAM